MNFRARTREEPEINLIPFIDVLLAVVIFLMLTTTRVSVVSGSRNWPTPRPSVTTPRK